MWLQWPKDARSNSQQNIALDTTNTPGQGEADHVRGRKPSCLATKVFISWLTIDPTEDIHPDLAGCWVPEQDPGAEKGQHGAAWIRTTINIRRCPHNLNLIYRIDQPNPHQGGCVDKC